MEETKKKRTYICIDLKSFYASVECVERGLDAMTTNLVVADASRTNKTICLAVSPAMKLYGLPGRCRLFEVEQKVKQINYKRMYQAYNGKFTGKSFDFNTLQKDPNLEFDYIVAPPRMKFYMDYSARIYKIYLKYIAAEDIHVYSIDEVFMDVTDYLKTYNCTPKELAMRIIRDVLKNTGITATSGIGENMYLAKVAMDIVAKHIPADENGVRIAEIDKISYRKELWNHLPLTDFWRVGKGIAKRLEKLGLYTMGDVARCSIDKEELLYKEFGVNAELLIDHAWGEEPCRIADIKSYKPQNNSLGNGQVLSKAYSFEKGKLVAKEMADKLSLDLVEKGLVSDCIALAVHYDSSSLENNYQGEIVEGYYGQQEAKPSHGSVKLTFPTSSSTIIVKAIEQLYQQIVNPQLFVRRIFVTMMNVISEEKAQQNEYHQQIDLFSYQKPVDDEKLKQQLQKEKQVQKALIEIKNKFGRNAVVKGMDKQKGATAMERNNQIGGHKS